MRQLHIIALVLSASFLMAACSSAPKLNEGAPVESHSGNMDGADARSVGTVNAGSSDPLNDPQGILAKRSVYFDLDSYTIKDEFKSVVEAHARYLIANKTRKVVIQGNTDERGGTEYN